MTTQEARQAQAIAELKEIADIRNGGKYPRGTYVPALRKAMAIVDSQAQKIAALTDCVEAGHKVMSDQAQRIAEQNQLLENCAISFKESLEQIAEQAKEISAQNVELINLHYDLQTARIQAEGVRSDIMCGETSYLRQYLDGHEFPWEKL